MARPITPRATARKRRFKRTPLRLALIALVLIGSIVGGLAYLARNWAPARDQYPVQGITISAASGEILWPAARAEGVDFAYIAATAGSDGRDPAFAANLAGARDAGLRYGAIHRYSLCRPASDQATRFIATVPRDAAMLPPVVQLDYTADCPARPSREIVLAELNTFLNQVETHAGKPALLRISHDFEAIYDISGSINRTLWLEGEFLPPDYAQRPWVMWTASTWRRVEGIEGPIEWDVVRP